MLRAYAPARSSKPRPRAPPPDPRLKSGLPGVVAMIQRKSTATLVTTHTEHRHTAHRHTDTDAQTATAISAGYDCPLFVHMPNRSPKPWPRAPPPDPRLKLGPAERGAHRTSRTLHVRYMCGAVCGDVYGAVCGAMYGTVLYQGGGRTVRCTYGAVR